MDTSQWPQVGLVKPMDDDITKPQTAEKKARPQEQLNCPRCNSTNTKFCYYNNYSLTQPRYFCKTCRRYWTEGGSLRNVPVGGGSRKNRKPGSISSIPSSKVNIPDLNPSNCSKLFPFDQNPKININEAGQDLNLAYVLEANKIENNNHMRNYGQQSAGLSQISAMDLLGSSGNNNIGSRTPGLSSFIPNLMPDSSTVNMYSSSTGMISNLQECKPRSNGVCHDHADNGNKILFPFGEVKMPVSISMSSTDQSHHDQTMMMMRGHDQGNISSNGYWSGLLGGGSSW